MSILVGKDTKLVVSGLTGREGSFHGLNNRRYGTDLVAGVTPGKAGQDVEGVPIFNTFHDAVGQTGANTAMIFVPPRFAADSILEAADAGVDLVIAITVSWVPLIPDYTRFSRDRRSAFFGTSFGYLLPTLFQFGFGSMLVLSRGVDPNRPELILTAIAGGGIAAALALLALTVDETDEAFANVYSGAVSTQNFFPRAAQRGLIVVASVVATAGALAIDMRSYQRFLLLLGAVFVPLLGVLVADWLARGMHYTRDDVFAGPALRPGSVLAWIAGFLVYEWLYQPADLGFWSRWLSHLWTPTYQIGASIPSFVVAFLLTAATVWLGSARAAARARREPLAGRR
jgi:purine-cytosine permease-like protein